MANSKVLVIDDDEITGKLIQKGLKKENIEVECCYSAKESLDILNNKYFNVLLLDYRLPDMNGFELLEKMQNLKLLEDTEVILITAYGDENIGIESIDKGCYDFIAKPFNIKNLVFRVKRVIEHLEYREKINILTQPFQLSFGNMIGTSNEMKKIYKTVNLVADKDTIILIEGETGTGKDLIARAIHQKSNRENNKFIPINCGALPEALLESELFGYEKGAFTGAVSKKYGIMETANNGTVFLDEINNTTLNVQSKLLRFIETGEFMRVGGNQVKNCNTRIIAASNQNIESLVEAKKFREDLYHRFNVVRIVLPPLRSRKQDIPLLIDYFLQIYNKKFGKKIKMNKTTINYLTQYTWPGNVRQLKNLIQSLIILNISGVIKPDDLPEKIRKDNVLLLYEHLPYKNIKSKLLADFEIKYFDNLLKKTKGNVSKAAQISKLSRRALIEKLKFNNINSSKYKFL